MQADPVMSMSISHSTAITVITTAYDATVKKRWMAQLAEQTPSMIRLAGIFEEELRHPELGLIRAGTITCEYFWLDRWHNVFAFFDPDESFSFFYCNITMPPVFHGKVLSYVDLDLDVLVRPDRSIQILDEDEFRQNSAKYAYPKEILNKTEESLLSLLTMVESRAFPFSETALRSV